MMSLRQIEKEILIKAPWGKIAGVAWGSSNNPPVLLCHGKLDASTGFRPLVSLLPDCFYYVSIDLPGNGRSDHLPKGVRYTVVDLVSTLTRVVEHFRWTTFRYIGHSLGVPIGKLYNITYPGKMCRSIELDPIPAHHTWPTTREGIQEWYHEYYGYYAEEKYAKFNGGPDTAPKYTYEKAQQLVMDSRALSKEASEHILERCLETAGDGLYRFTFDQRMKEVTVLPFSGELLQKIYTSTTTPTLCVLAQSIIDAGIYNPVPFLMDPAAWKGLYKYKIVNGGHDVHIEDPGCMAEDISKFLVEDFKNKLFTFDQRMKEVTVLPFSGELLQKIYTSTTTPTLCVLAQSIIDAGIYNPVPFLMDPAAWKGLYKYKIVNEGHDVHIEDPGCMAEDISKFLMEDFKNKL